MACSVTMNAMRKDKQCWGVVKKTRWKRTKGEEIMKVFGTGQEIEEGWSGHDATLTWILE